MPKQDLPADLRVGLMPVDDCLPFYAAQEGRIFEKNDLRVKLITFNSALKCAAALRDGKIDAAYLSLPQAVYLIGQGIKIHSVMAADGKMTVITNRNKRLKKLSELAGRTIAVSRHNISDFIVDDIARLTGIKQFYLLRPQINDLHIRLHMLDDGQVDAAVLPAPYDAVAIGKGNRKVFSNKDKKVYFASIAVLDSVIKNKKNKVTGFLRSYREAVRYLNDDRIRADSIYIREFGIDPDDVKVLARRRFAEPRPVAAGTFAEIASWCRSRGYIRTSPSASEFINSEFINRSK